MGDLQAGRTAQMLVVDDDPRSRKLLEGYLRAEGYAVRGAPDGPKALTMVQQLVPDVILLDVMMPHMTGHEVCEILKSDPETRLCQIMLVTALDSTPDRVEGLDTGADDYISKPVRREEFLAKVRALLRVRHLIGELDAAREELAERNRELELKKTLAQSLVHDLKNPLSAILGNLDLLEMRMDPVAPLPMVQRSKQGAKRMQKMIMNLLDVERLEQGRLIPALERFDALQLAADAVAESRVAAEQKQIQLDLRGSEAVTLEADPALLRRVLDNLLANALHHSPQGSTVSIEVSLRDEGVELVVSDQGCGIPEEHRESVFDKYRQLDLRRSGVSTNRGLGLTFCRLAVEAHGGTIWIESAPAGGACFRLLLPDSAAGEMSRPDELVRGSVAG